MPMNKKLFVLGKEKLKSKASMFKNVDNSIGLSLNIYSTNLHVCL